MGTPPDDPAPGEDVFTDDDLAPDSEVVRANRRSAVDKAATIVAVIAFGMIGGGMTALGAAAAPVVFQLPDPLSGNTMGAAFARFDSIAITCALIGLAAELVRTLVTLKTPASRHRLPRVRRYLAILLALGTLFVGLHLSPQIMSAYQRGVRRDVGAEGAALEQTHRQAETVGKLIVALAAALMALHVLTMSPRGAGSDDDDDEDVLGPLPPGPATR